MTSATKQNSGMWNYLESIGVLEHGTEGEIKAAKRAYRKKYLLEYKRKQRISQPEFVINLSKENGAYERISTAAKQHQMSVTAFLRTATLAYLNRTYIVPDKLQIAKLEQLLAQYLNEIQTLVQQKEKYHWDRDRKYEAIEKRIEKLETEIHDMFSNPPLLNNNQQITTNDN